MRIGPSWIGRKTARWMLDCFCPDREGRYISAAVPRYPMMPGASFPIASARDVERARAQLEELRARNAFATSLADEVRRNMASANEYLHAHPEVMQAWLDGHPPGSR